MSEVAANLSALFKNYTRVVYDTNPLFEVILQVRFPTYLRLQSEPPSAFQDALLSDYPLYELEEVLEVLQQPSPSAPMPVLREIKVHRFLSHDRKWLVRLRPDRLSISAKEYKQWEQFRDRAKFCLKAFYKHYPVRVATRVGLRYRDLFKPSEIGKDGGDWSALINPSILGPMGSEAFSLLPFDAARWNQRFAIDDVKVTLQGGLQTTEGAKCYFLDCDISSTKEMIVGDDMKALESELERLHEPVGPLFRWAITDELHERLGPKPV